MGGGGKGDPAGAPRSATVPPHVPVPPSRRERVGPRTRVGGSVPVPAASLDGARRTGCEWRRPAGGRVPDGAGGPGRAPGALPVLPVQSRLWLWPRLVRGWEMLGAGSVGTAAPRPQAAIQLASVASDRGWEGDSAVTPLHPQIPPPPGRTPPSASVQKKPVQKKTLPFPFKPVA